MKMTPEYANLLGGQLSTLLNKKSLDIESAFKEHGDTLKIACTINLTVVKKISGPANRAGVSISFDPYPKNKPPEKIKDVSAFDFDPGQMKMFEEDERGHYERYPAEVLEA